MKHLQRRRALLNLVSLCALIIAGKPTGIAIAAEATAAVVSGPMAGEVVMRSAKLWAQWNPSAAGLPTGKAPAVRLWVEWWPRSEGGSARTHSRSAPLEALAAQDWNVQFHLTGLQPGTQYEARVHWESADRSGVSAVSSFSTAALWMRRTDPPPLRVLAGSCAYTNDPADDRPGVPFGTDTGIYMTMASRSPDLTLWMGDSVYLREPDFGDEAASSARYAKWRALPDLQPLLRTGSHLAIWDDHEFGPNDSNSSWVHKGMSLALFKRYWVNPTYGLPEYPGVFSQSTRSDVEFFLLDGRWSRDSDRSLAHDKQLFGPTQMAWLRNALLASTATWKVVVSGSQLFNDRNRFEGWNNFPRERQAFIDWMTDHRVRGVLFLSGDRHFSAAFEWKREGTYPLREFTCSPLTAGTFANRNRELEDNATLVSGSAVGRQNFCQLDFSGPRGSRELQLQMIDAHGQVAWSRTLREEDMR